MKARHDTVIIGGGLAGLSAAYHLIRLDPKQTIHIIEAKDVWGGRTSSWVDGGMPVESGLHRFLGFYKELPSLLESCGVNLDDMLCWEDEIEVRLPDGQPAATFGLSPVHRPLKTLGGIIGNNDFLSVADKAKLAVFFSKGLELLAEKKKGLDKLSVQDIADQVGLSSQIVTRVLVPLTDGIFFMKPHEFSAYIFFTLLIQGMKRPHQLRVGAYMGGMSEVMIEPIRSYLQGKGVTFKSGEAASQVEAGDEGWVITAERGTTYESRRVVVATSLKPAQDLLRSFTSGHAYFQHLQELAPHPALTLQIETSAPIMEVDRTEFSPDTVLASYAEQSRTTFRHADGRLSLIFTEPGKYMTYTKEQLLECVCCDLKRLGLHMGQITEVRKIAHPHDFYKLAPGMEVKRPLQKSPLPGLYLAGDYTKQDYFATMEGAVISGRHAAEAIIRDARISS